MDWRYRLLASLAAVLTLVAATSAQEPAQPRLYPSVPFATSAGAPTSAVQAPFLGGQPTGQVSGRSLAALPGEPLPGPAPGDSLTAPEDADTQKAPPPFGGPILERSLLTGDWFGCRATLRDCGITVDVSTTQFYQGVASGGLEQSFRYGGRNDYFMTLDGEKLGLWKGFSIKIHGETRYGDSPNFITGALSPVNEYLLVPGEQGVVSGLTGVKFSQYLSDNALVYTGKINLLDEIRQPLTNATGLEGFMNTSLIFNTILARTLPYSAFGAGFYYLKDKEPVFLLSVFDTRDASTTSVFDNFFTNGAVIFGTVHLPTKFLGLPGHQGLDVVYSSGRYTDVQESKYLDPITELVIPSSPKSGSWAVGYLMDQALWVAPDDPQRVWGVFGKFGISDGNPNPIRWTAMAGVSGASPLPGRPRDTFGLGYFCLGLSDALKRGAPPDAPLRNEHGVELYYNARVTPWFQLTPDLQVLVPFEQHANTAVVVGLRAKVDF
jgi:porin